MPNLKNNPKSGGQVKRNGQHTKGDMMKVERQEFARDDLSGAFAGKQHEVRGKVTEGNLTHLNARKTKANADKTPKR